MKKLVSLLIIAMMFIGMTTNIYASEFNKVKVIDIDTEIDRALNGITDVPIPQEMLDGMNASIIKNDGTEVPVEVKATIRKVKSNLRNGGVEYILTAVAATNKYSSGNSSPHNSKIDVTAYGTMSWTDNLGVNNVLNYVSGSWVCGKNSSVTGGRRVVYAIDGVSVATIKEPTANKFSYNGISLKGLKFYLETYANVTNTNGDTERLKLRVTTKITD